MGNGRGERCQTEKLRQGKWKERDVARLLKSGNVNRNYSKKRRKVMGRAIDMEKDIDTLKREVGELKSILQDILNEVKDEKKETKKANTKSSKASSGKSTARPESSES